MYSCNGILAGNAKKEDTYIHRVDAFQNNYVK